MSKQFELLVLEKLDAINNKVSNLESAVASLDNRVSNLESTVAKNNVLINQCITEIKDTQDIVFRHNNVFIQLEHEISNKFKTLFDFFSINSDNHNTYDESISTLNAKVFNHETRIAILEDISNKKLASFSSLYYQKQDS